MFVIVTSLSDITV